MRFRHAVNTLNDWATGDSGLPEEEEKQNEEEQQEEKNGEARTLVSLGFGSTYCTL